MRWPWQRVERREATGGFTGIISQLIEAQAAGTTQHASATAAMEAAAGALSRAFADATVDAPADVTDALDPRTLGQIGRDLIRVGESLHVIRMTGGRLHLVPCSTWYWEGGADPETWLCTATAYGPSGSETWRVPWSSVVFVAWGSPTARPYHGLGPGTWARDTARLASNAERSLANEAGGPLAQLLAIPQDGGGQDQDDDPLSGLKSDIAKAAGKALLVETTAAGWGDGMGGAPHADWKPSRLGPLPPESMVELSDAAFARVLAACGASPALFDDSDGTAKREALRQWHMGTVRPLARVLAFEATEKFGVPVEFRFDAYALDLQARATSFQKYVAGGMEIDKALALTGLVVGDMDGDDA